MDFRHELRYWYHWLQERFPLIAFFVFGVAVGIIAYNMRAEWLDMSMMASLETQCHDRMGARATLVYRERRFYCLPERP